MAKDTYPSEGGEIFTSSLSPLVTSSRAFEDHPVRNAEPSVEFLRVLPVVPHVHDQ